MAWMVAPSATMTGTNVSRTVGNNVLDGAAGSNGLRNGRFSFSFGAGPVSGGSCMYVYGDSWVAKTEAAAMSFDSASYPYRTVVYITDTVGIVTFQGSGVLISPDEVLTASHVVYSSDLGVVNVNSISVTPAYSAGQAPFGSASAIDIHYFRINDPNDTISTSQSQFDYAVVHLSQPFPDLGYMELQSGFAGGPVNVTGYPAIANGLMESSQQTVVQDPIYSVLEGVTIGQGSSGGPVWITGESGPYVVGTVSSGQGVSGPGTFTQITSAAFNQIESWVQQDDGASNLAPEPVATTVNLSGGETVNLTGSTLVNIISGANTINTSAGADTIFAGAGATETTVKQSGSASIMFQGSDAPALALDWFVGGTGGATITEGANHMIVDVNTNTGTGAVFIAGKGAETLFGAFSSTNDAYWGSFSGGSDLMFAGSGNDALVAGGGAQTLAGGSGSDTFYLINPALVGSIVHAAEPAGFYAIYNAHKGDTIALTGYDSLYGAAGSQAAAASVSASLAAGASVVRLNDGTIVNFVGGGGGASVISS